MNHIAFAASSKNEVDDFYKNTLVKNNIKCLYEEKPHGDDTYYGVFFEDPDRIKLEVVYSPQYCNALHWTNTLESDFDPYGK